jgi:O-antigen ligase
MESLQKYSLYLYCFSINFEQWDPFSTGVDFLFTKISIVIYLLFSITNFKKLYSLKNIKIYIYPIFIFFIFLTFMSYVNKSDVNPDFFNISFFLNLLVLIIAINQSKNEPQLLLQCLFVFSISTVVMTLMYFSGMQSVSEIDNRGTIFGKNQNDLGINLAISIMTFFSIYFENKLKLLRIKYLIFFTFPLMLIFLVRTGSRVAFISLFISLIVFFVLRRTKIKGLKLFTSLLLFVLFSFAWELYFKNTYVAERLTKSIDEGDLSGRDLIWVAAFEIITNNPLIGIGETGYAKEIEPILEYFSSPHNVIIEVLCYTGVVGLILFMFFFIKTIKCGLRAYLNNNEILPLLLLFSITGMILSGQIFATKIAWVVFAYIISSNFNTSSNELSIKMSQKNISK